MKTYVGITDSDWFNILSALQPEEVNFWKPGGTGGFGTLQPGELFLFKLHSPDNYIVGGGHFVRFSQLPVSLAWLAFGDKNGVRSKQEFDERIWKYRKGPKEPDPQIGCIILNQPFFFPREQWIPAPTEWPRSTVQGKTYDNLDPQIAFIRAEVLKRLKLMGEIDHIAEESARYGEYLTKARLGQGAFRVLVTEAYDRRCAITGEKTLPVLEAAHIKPYSEDGPHQVKNGLLLRADMHLLFDAGLISVTPEYNIAISSKIEEEYSNGKVYYSYQGQKLRSLPLEISDLPDKEYLEWHFHHIYAR